MRPQAIIIIAVLFAAALALIALGPTSYRKVEELQTLEAQTEALRKEFPEFEHLRPETIAELIEVNRDLILIDVRREEEYLVSHIPGAVHLETPEEISAYLGAAAPVPNVIVFCSSSGVRACETLRKMPEKWPISAANLAGGIFAWANQGRSLQDGKGEPVLKVHPESHFHGRFLAEDLRLEIEE